MADRELLGKVAIVTGATRKRGLGRALALCLARAGADVVATGSGTRTADQRPADERDSGWQGAQSIADEARALGVRTLALDVDVTDAEAVRALVQRTVAELGRIDILINNATFARGDDRVPVVELDEAMWRRIVDINLTGTMLCCKYVARELIRQGQGGSIVSISSGAALKAEDSFSAYAASKAAVHALSSSLADELGPHGVTVNVVAPGFLDTARIDMLRAAGRWEQRVASIPLGRAGTPEEVAETVRFLCGPHARWISGEVLLINGGEVRRAAR
jgi:3-oxoacyl-[acyl-carrier protein] reductase/meso-butanediol dehydrogenase/(S,S)-butanediol dehydrogenase/diacetyl reductase